MLPRRLAAAAALLAALTACSSEPAPAPTITKAPKLTQAEITSRCTDAVAERAVAERAGKVAFEPTPEPCAPLTEDDYLDAYMDGIAQANQAGRDALQRQLDEAEDADQP